jgi:nucleotide-binding universal stress UspA family protein
MTTEKISKILITVSGSAADEEAIRIACTQAKQTKAQVHVLYVIEVDRTLPLHAVIEDDIAKAEQILTHAEDIAVEEDYAIETDLVQAREAGPAIVEEALAHNFDLIVMSLTYKKRFGKFNIGRAAPYVFESAPCRVLLYRTPITEGGD